MDELGDATLKLSENGRYFENDLDAPQKEKPRKGKSSSKYANNVLEAFRDNCVRITTEIVEEARERNASLYGASIYVGLCGIAVMLLEVSRNACTEEERQEQLKMAMEFAIARPRFTKKLQLQGYTFLEGTAGPLAVQAVIHHRQGNAAEAEECLEKLLNLATDVDQLNKVDCELLYGRCGYLYSWVFTEEVWKGSLKLRDSIVETVRRISDAVVAEGLGYGDPSEEANQLLLNYEWQRKRYLGGAHGLCGIYLTLCLVEDLLAGGRDGVTSSPSSSSTVQLVCSSTEYVVNKFSFPSGNIAASIGSKQDKLVHWCHGSTGWIPLLVDISRRLPHKRADLLSSAAKCGEVVWQRGLLRKGLGLCHGIAGNGFSFLSLFRETGDPMWLNRANQFALFGLQHYGALKLVPDRRLSLFEGVAGFNTFLSHLASPVRSYFVGYESPGGGDIPHTPPFSVQCDVSNNVA